MRQRLPSKLLHDIKNYARQWHNIAPAEGNIVP